MSDHEAVVEGKKSPKKLIIIIVAVLLLLGGGGAGYYFLVLNKAPAAGEHAEKGDKKGEHKASKEEEHAAEDEHAAKAEHEEEEDDHGEAKTPVFYDLAQPMTVNFPRTGSFSLIQVALSFYAESEEVTAVLKKHEPMVRNNLMMKINAQNPEMLKTKDGKEALRAVILDEVNKVLEKMSTNKHRVKEVFITSFVMQ